MNYPNGIKRNNESIYNINNNIDYSNRGMSLEKDLNISNEYYKDIDKAIIYKKPTPIKIAKVSYPSRSKAIINEAYFSTPSTTDYNGIYKGYYIDFEAKETKSKTSFNLNNIHPHQIKHLNSITKHNGIAFLIVRFTTLNRNYLLLEKDLNNYLNNNVSKSIPLEYFESNAYIIKDGYIPRLDYLKIIDKLIGGN